MSWQTLNTILGRAMVDTQFADRLLADPSAAIQEFGFTLTEEEQQFFRQINISDMSELSRLLLERFAPDRDPN